VNQDGIIILKKKAHFLIGFGIQHEISFDYEVEFDKLDLFLKNNNKQIVFTTLSYDIKNNIEKLCSNNLDNIEFPMASFWTCKVILETNFESFKIIEGEFNNKFIQQFETIKNAYLFPKKNIKTKFKARTNKNDYIKNVEKIKNEIQEGNVYELNYCQEFYSENVDKLDTLNLFFQVDKLTNAPFSCYVDNGNQQLICGSPERFINKSNSKISSQPIKGTIKRGRDKEEDTILKYKLLNDPKERAENVMITDLVRNDLSKIAKKNSVEVDELCGLYSFGTVHQLISTISCEVDDKINFSSIIKALFPMGSMTGAPKISAMELIEKHEDFKRGIYSGSVGYFAPNGDFDLNVVIRSFVYYSKNNYLSCAVGGAITNQSNAELEYEECLTKVLRLLKLFGDDQL
jgi:para-aminobenzoate synthetase component I